MANTNPDAKAVVDFWRRAGPEKWFTKSADFDDEFRSRFNALHEKAAAGELSAWLHTGEEALALVLLLDQFPRNCFRSTERMYESDPLARLMTRRAIELGLDQEVEEDLRGFFYLPFSHSELPADQEMAVELGGRLSGDFVNHARGHRDIIARFGRFPHRNEILGRMSTADEQKFLDEGGFRG